MSATRPPPPLLLAATTEVLRKHVPFDGMAGAELDLLASRLKLRYFARGERIVGPASGPVENLFIVQRGTVRGRAPSRGDAEEVALGEGECFPLGALIGRRPTTLDYTAASDVFTYVLAEPGFLEVMRASRDFHLYCTQRLAHLLERSALGVREAFAGRACAELGMASPLAATLRRAPVTLPGTARVREVLELMAAKRVGSVVITDAQGRPEGIFTQTDVLHRVALSGGDLSAPVATVMTRDPVRLQGSHPVGEAAQLMARHGFRHLLVMDGERLAGVISERDLFAMQRRSAQGLRKDMAGARTREELAFVAREARGQAGELLAQGVGAESLLQLVTASNDGIVERAVALAAVAHGVSGFCWIGLGSEGRMEQTLATDQDNAIIFPDDAPAGERERLLAFAAEANDTLAACGFPLCKGNIMARNPLWCLSLSEWTARFDDWMRNASPQALLNAAIFFDLRPLAGEAGLAAALRDFLRTHVTQRPAFLRQMAQNALEVRPPIGFLEELSLSDGAGTIDLKREASRPFVDGARILSLAAGVDASSTSARLRAAGPRIRMGPDEVESIVQAFHFIQMLRLRHQEARGVPAGDAADNVMDRASLSTLDRRILREALRQARKLQDRVALDYRLA